MMQRTQVRRKRQDAQEQRGFEYPTPERAGAAAVEAEPAAPGLVEEAISLDGQPLDTATRAAMEPRFGHDFSRVRIHADGPAAESARVLDARAYTLGPDVVFGAGQYAPGTDDGQRLIAHELAHVVQQAAGPVSGVPLGGGLALSQPGDPSERVADWLAAAPAGEAREPYGVAEGAGAAGDTIQRSLFGSIVGGIVGGVGGFFAGGPLGAVAGAVAGAAVGESLTTRSRSLKSEEITYAKEIYKDSLDYAAITITRGSTAATGGTARTLGNTINMDDDEFAGDTLDFTPEGMEILIHEMAHVWQYQHTGWTYAPAALWAQFKAWVETGDRNVAYDWRALDTAGVPWDDWNPEAQAEAVEDYNKALRATRESRATAEHYQDLARLQKYMARIQAGPPPRAEASPAGAGGGGGAGGAPATPSTAGATGSPA